MMLCNLVSCILCVCIIFILIFLFTLGAQHIAVHYLCQIREICQVVKPDSTVQSIAGKCSKRLLYFLYIDTPSTLPLAYSCRGMDVLHIGGKCHSMDVVVYVNKFSCHMD